MELTRDLEHTAREVQRRMRARVREVKRRMEDLNEDVTTTITDNPVKCLLGALAVGVIIGKLARR